MCRFLPTEKAIFSLDPECTVACHFKWFQTELYAAPSVYRGHMQVCAGCPSHRE